MAKMGLCFIVLLSMIGFLSNGSLAQDYTQWHLPEGAKLRLGKGNINDVKFSQDGTLLAVATGIGVWLYDAPTGAEILLLNNKPQNVRKIAFSPDGRTLAAGGWARSDAIQLWNLDTAAQVSAMGKGIGSVGVLAFSEDGKTLASVGSSQGLRFYVWDVDTGLEVSHFKGQQNHFNFGVLAVSPNHRFFASAGGNRAFLWDTETQTLKHTIEGNDDSVWALAFSPDSKTLVIGSTTIRFWDVETGSQMSRLDGHTGKINTLTFAPDGGTLASGDANGEIRLWNIGAGGDQLTLPRLLGGITGKGKPLSDSPALTEHKRPIEALAFTADGTTLVSASRDTTIRLWDVDTRNPHLTIKGHTEAIKALGFLEDGKTLASGSSDCTLRLWNTETRDEQLIPIKHRWSALDFAFSQDGKTVVLGSPGSNMRLRNTDTGDVIATFRTAHKGYINQVKFSPDDKILASGSRGGSVELWDVRNQRRITTLSGHKNEIRVLAFSPDGKTVATAALSETIIVLWDVINIGRKTALLAEHITETGAVTFSPDGKMLVSGHRDGSIYSWDAATGKQLSTFTGAAGNVTALAFSPDGKMLANGSIDGAVRLWDPSTYTPIGDTLIGHASRVNELTFSPDGDTLFSGGSDGTILFWDLENILQKHR